MNLKIVSVTQKYSNKTAVDNVNLEFTPGIWGLLGPNGAGKTTLMKLLVGIRQPTEGEILYEDKSIDSLGMSYRECLGYLPQKFGCYDNLTVKEYLHYVAQLKGIHRKQAENRIMDLLKEVNLLLEEHQKIKRLSGGMRQRVGIAQAMLNDPKILILDEPTAGLDIEERRKFREYITSISRNKVVIISTHIVSDIEFISNNIAIINDGVILSSGKTDKLIQELNGKVWKKTVRREELEKWKQKVLLVNYHNNNNKETSIRFISEDQNLEDVESIQPELNDYYLYMNRKMG